MGDIEGESEDIQMSMLKRIRNPIIIRANTKALKALHRNYDDDSDIAIATLARYGNTVLLCDILDTEDLFDSSLISKLIELYSLWVDKDAIIHRKDNLLIPPDDQHWRIMLRFAMSHVVARKGMHLSYDPGFTFRDAEAAAANRAAVVALFDLYEEEYSDFDGPTEDDTPIGYICDVMYADGKFGKMRYVSTAGENMKEVEKIIRVVSWEKLSNYGCDRALIQRPQVTPFALTPVKTIIKLIQFDIKP